MKFFDLHWVCCQDKGIPVPNLVYWDNGFGGEYFSPRDWCVIDGKWIDAKNGVIVVNPKIPSKYHAGVIAHEWRHHWQKFNGWKYDGCYKSISDPTNYNVSTRKFIMESKSEFDAVKFQWKFGVLYDEWYEIFHDVFPLHFKSYFFGFTKPLDKDYSKFAKYFK